MAGEDVWGGFLFHLQVERHGWFDALLGGQRFLG